MSWQGTHGYVIDGSREKWLSHYQPRWDCASDCVGEPTHFDHKRLRHPKVSELLKARFAVWAYTMITRAQSQRFDPEFVAAMRNVDLHGRVLAAVLRSEIGPGPAIIYVDMLPPLSGGPDQWRVTDDGKLVPYRHRPSAGYVIEARECGGWAWEYQPASESMSGNSVGVGPVWSGEQAIARELVTAFSCWQDQWKTLGYKPQDIEWHLDCEAHHKQGLALGQRLKQTLGATCRVFYKRTLDEADQGELWEAMELGFDGTARPYVHAPYWAGADVIRAEGPGRSTP
jgi:hypothetical protein